MLELLIEHRVDVNARGHWGTVALQDACEIGSVAMARVLIDHRADVNPRDAERSSPLLRAANKPSRHAIVEFMIDHGAQLAPGETVHPSDMKTLIATRKYRWGVKRHRYAPREVKQRIEALLLVRQGPDPTPLACMPIELMFMLFEWM